MRRILMLMMAVAMFSPKPASAQARARYGKQHVADTVPVLVKSYMDSLQVVHARIDSLAASRYSIGGGQPNGRYYRLFVPLTFYHNISGNVFRIGSNESPLDESLLSVYLNRPDLVRSTQSQLDRVGPIIDTSPKAVTPDADIVEKVIPKINEDDVISPVDIYVEKPNFWKFSGDYSLQLFQNYLSDNWYQGGESNYSMIAAVTLQANYNNKQKLRWDNKLEMRLGFQNSRGDTLHTIRTSEDLIRYTGKIGIQASKNWYYTLQLIASTQFMRGLRSNDPRVYSRFLAPLYVNPSLGMNYNVNWFKGRLRGSVHLAPIAYSLTYVKNKSLATRFGVEAGKHTKDDFGSEMTVDLTWQMAKDVRWKTRLYGYTTYKRVKMEWENTFTFIVNKYISANVFLYPRFDDGGRRDKDYGYWQFKEYISLGFNYGF